MKKIKLLLAVIAVVAMLFTVAFAADSVIKFEADTVEYIEGEQLVISVYSAIDGTFDQDAYFCLTYDKTVWDVDTSDSRVSSYATSNTLDVTVSYDADVPASVGDKLIDVKFTKKDGANAIGTVFELGENDGEFYVAGESVDYSGTITVVAAATDEKVYATDEIDPVATEIVDKATDTFYKNLAVFDTVISLDGTKTAKKVGLKLASSLSQNTFEVENAITTAISGDGQVAYAVIVYNVPTTATVTATPFVVYGN